MNGVTCNGAAAATIWLSQSVDGQPVRPEEQLAGGRELLTKSAWREAREMLRSVVTKLRASSDQDALAEALSGVSQAAIALGECAEAAESAREAAGIYEERRDSSKSRSCLE